MLGYESRQSRDFRLLNSVNGIEQGFIMPNFRGREKSKNVPEKVQGGVNDNG